MSLRNVRKENDIVIRIRLR